LGDRVYRLTQGFSGGVTLHGGGETQPRLEGLVLPALKNHPVLIITGHYARRQEKNKQMDSCSTGTVPAYPCRSGIGSSGRPDRGFFQGCLPDKTNFPFALAQMLSRKFAYRLMSPRWVSREIRFPTVPLASPRFLPSFCQVIFRELVS
jgi:hypothetical protein